jgi:hypothetical protein
LRPSLNSFSITATGATLSIPSKIKVDQSLWMVTLFSGLGLALSACVIALGGDLSAVLLY